MKSIAKFATIIVALAFLLAAGSAFAQAKFHIGVVTGTVSQSEDDLRGAEQLIKEYKTVKDGGMIQHITYPDDFMSQQETFISTVVSLADDPLMKAIVVNQAIPGTAEAFKRVKAKRPDILLLAGEPHEDPAGHPERRRPRGQRRLRVPRLHHHLGRQADGRQDLRAHLLPAAHVLRVPRPPAGDHGRGLQGPRASSSPSRPLPTRPPTSAWPAPSSSSSRRSPSGSRSTARTAPSSARTTPTPSRCSSSCSTYGGLFVEADLPSPLMGYPGALGIDLSKEAGNFPAILKKVEQAVVDKGGKGRFGTWAFSYGYTVTAGLGEFAKNVIEGKANKDSLKDLFAAYGKYTPGAKWNGAYYTD